jgi:hypothetical protein
MMIDGMIARVREYIRVLSKGMTKRKGASGTKEEMSKTSYVIQDQKRHNNTKARPPSK